MECENGNAVVAELQKLFMCLQYPEGVSLLLPQLFVKQIKMNSDAFIDHELNNDDWQYFVFLKVADRI